MKTEMQLFSLTQKSKTNIFFSIYTFKIVKKFINLKNLIFFILIIYTTYTLIYYLILYRYCQLLCMTLNNMSIDNVCLHGFMRQKERVSALNRFKSNHVRTLIATDVAARGLDIPSVQLVINHRLPRTPTEYIHRVGRTARAGRKGVAISILRFPRDLELLGEIEATINTKLTEHPIDRKC